MRFLGLACGFPRNFELEANAGGTFCLSKDSHLHTESDCEANFKTVNKHKFEAVDGGSIPQNWCQLRFSYNNEYLRTKDFPKANKEIVSSFTKFKW